MITLFTTPRAFRGHMGTIQRNALESWARLSPRPEVLLMGPDEGTPEAAAEFGMRYIPGLEVNSYGTPLVSSMFERAESAATFPILCHINADIILLNDFLPAVEGVAKAFTAFLLLGQRWDCDITEPLTFDHQWQDVLRTRVKAGGRLHEHTAMDYFVFPRGLLQTIPPFANGRTSWDGWVVRRARSIGAAVIDLTADTTVVHQNHGYSHVSGGEHSAKLGEEARRNWELAGGLAGQYNICDATHVLKRGRIQRPFIQKTGYSAYRRVVALAERSKMAAAAVGFLQTSRVALRGLLTKRHTA